MIKGFLFIFIFTSFLASSIDGQNYIDTIFCGEYKIYDVNSLVTKSANKVDFIFNKNQCVAAVGAMKEDVSLEEFVNIFKALDYGISGEGIVNGDFINYIEGKGYSLNSLCELEDILSNLTEDSHTDEVCSEKGGFHDVLITRIRIYEGDYYRITFKNPQVGTIKALKVSANEFNKQWTVGQFSTNLLLSTIINNNIIISSFYQSSFLFERGIIHSPFLVDTLPLENINSIDTGRSNLIENIWKITPIVIPHYNVNDSKYKELGEPQQLNELLKCLIREKDGDLYFLSSKKASIFKKKYQILFFEKGKLGTYKLRKKNKKKLNKLIFTNSDKLFVVGSTIYFLNEGKLYGFFVNDFFEISISSFRNYNFVILKSILDLPPDTILK